MIIYGSFSTHMYPLDIIAIFCLDTYYTGIDFVRVAKTNLFQFSSEKGPISRRIGRFNLIFHKFQVKLLMKFGGSFISCHIRHLRWNRTWAANVAGTQVQIKLFASTDCYPNLKSKQSGDMPVRYVEMKFALWRATSVNMVSIDYEGGASVIRNFSKFVDIFDPIF